MDVKNQIIYLELKPSNLFNELSIKEWNDLIDSYSNDPESIVEPYDKTIDGHCFITTSLFNILNKHSIMDLRFNVGFRTIFHKTDFKL